MTAHGTPILTANVYANVMRLWPRRPAISAQSHAECRRDERSSAAWQSGPQYRAGGASASLTTASRKVGRGEIRLRPTPCCWLQSALLHNWWTARLAWHTA